MGIFKLSKRNRVLDLTERYNKQQERAKIQTSENKENSETNNLGFLADFANSSQSNNNFSEEHSDGARKKLAKRLMDITDKLEDLSNQIYHLQQRVEVLEKKMQSR